MWRLSLKDTQTIWNSILFSAYNPNRHGWVAVTRWLFNVETDRMSVCICICCIVLWCHFSTRVRSIPCKTMNTCVQFSIRARFFPSIYWRFFVTYVLTLFWFVNQFCKTERKAENVTKLYILKTTFTDQFMQQQ